MWKWETKTEKKALQAPWVPRWVKRRINGHFLDLIFWFFLPFDTNHRFCDCRDFNSLLSVLEQ